MPSPANVKFLLTCVLGLPVLMAVLGWVADLLAALGDDPASAVLNHTYTGASVLWLLSVVALVVVLAIEKVDEQSE